MVFLPYIPNKNLKKLGLVFLLGGIAGLSYLLISYHYSGKVVATASLTKPIEETSIGLQSLQAQSQSKLQNTMNKAGIFTLKTDLIERLDVVFQPLHLTTGMGKITLVFDVEAHGIYAENGSTFNRRFGETYYKLTDIKSGKIVFEQKSETSKFDTAGDGIYAIVDHTHRDSAQSISFGGGYSVITDFVVPKDSDYILEARLEKLKFSYPVSNITLLAKKGMKNSPSFSWVGSFFGSIVIGYILLLIGTPPEKRMTRKKERQQSKI